jgi:DNA-directed RNA polymerase subunit RPC12/RpoP
VNTWSELPFCWACATRLVSGHRHRYEIRCPYCNARNVVHERTQYRVESLDEQIAHALEESRQTELLLRRAGRFDELIDVNWVTCRLEELSR